MIAALVSGGVVVVAVVSFAWWAAAAIRSAEQRAADARVGEQTKAGQLAVAASDIATHKARADREKERADALDDVLDDVAADGDAAGGRERVLRRLTRKEANDPDRAPGGAGPELVPASGPNPAVAGELGDALLEPGQ